MISVKVDTSGLMRLQAELAGKSKQVRFATSRALNAAAHKASQATKDEMRKVFDRPTPWVLGSVRYTKATKSKLESTVDFDFWGNKQGVTVSKVLNAEIFGGQRKLKRHEAALRRMGALPTGMAIVPGVGAKLDSFGNMSSGQINQILSWFSAFGEQGYKANMTAKTRDRRARGTKKSYGFEYFVVSPGARRTWSRGEGKSQGSHKMQPGIYLRTITGYGSAIKPVMIFVRMPAYKRRLDFYGVAERAARKEFNEQFPSMLNEAMRTAK